MEDDKGQVRGDAASVYDEFFVPALFQEWAPRVASAARLEPGQRVLDVACGTGVLAREAARRVGAASVSGLDCNPAMLAVAARAAPDIDWQPGRAEELPFAAGAFDAVVSQFGLMFFDDPAAALGEMRRVLRPGGALAVAVWARIEDSPGYAAMAGLLERLFGERIARELYAPFRLGEPGATAALLRSSGWPEADLATVSGVARFPSLDAWLFTDVRGWTLADKIDDDQYAHLRAEAAGALAAFVRPDGQVEFAVSAHIATARRSA